MKEMTGRRALALLLSLVITALPVSPLFGEQQSDSTSEESVVSPAKYKTIKLTETMSLYELLDKAGYKLKDDEVASFLKEFSSLNEEINALSAIKKGTTVKLPVLAGSSGPTVTRQRAPKVAHAHRRVSRGRRASLAAVRRADRGRVSHEVVTKNIVTCLKSLYGSTVTEDSGLKLFQVNGNSEISLDASRLPVIRLNNRDAVVLDPSGALPPEIKGIIESLWPEYRIISYGDVHDLGKIIGTVLESLGFTVGAEKRVVAGGVSQVEYLADLLVIPPDSDVMDSDINLIGIIGAGEYATPEALIMWFRDRGVNIIELSYDGAKRLPAAGGAPVSSIGGGGDVKEFTSSLLTEMGFPFSSNVWLSLSNRPEYSFNLRADLSVSLDQRTKVIEFAPVLSDEIDFARRRGYDIEYVEPGEERRRIIEKVMSLLSLSNRNSRGGEGASLTPHGTKYRLVADGFYFVSANGRIFLTHSEFDTDLLRNLVDHRVKIVRY